jgi:hypothetical protein
MSERQKARARRPLPRRAAKAKGARRRRPQPRFLTAPLSTTTPTIAGTPRAFRSPTEVEVDFLVVLAAQLQARFPGGLPSWYLDNAAEITAEMAKVYPNLSLAAEGIGLAFDTKSLAAYWRISERKLRRMAAGNEVFSLRLPSGRLIYPDYQIGGDGVIVAGFFELVNAANPAFADRWDLARWLAETPTQPSPVRLLLDGEIEEATARARELAPADAIDPSDALRAATES